MVGAEDVEGGGLGGGGGGEVNEKLACARDAGVVDGEDEVSGDDAGGGGAVFRDGGDDDATIAVHAFWDGEVAGLDADGFEDGLWVFWGICGGGGGGAGGVALDDGGGEGENLSFSPDGEGDGLADFGALEKGEKLVGVFDFLAVEGLDDVCGLESGGLGGGIWGDAADGGTFAVWVAEFGAGGEVEVGDHADAEEAADGAAALEDLKERFFDIVGGDGEADALEAGVLFVWREDGDVDADDFSAEVDEGAAGVSGVDGGVGLEEVALGV